MTLNDEDKNIMIKVHMEKAEKALKTAVLISETDDYDGAANRAYYSIFHAENALLLTKDISGNSHKHVHNSISKEFVKPGALPDDMNRRIKEVERIRATGDYSKTKSVTKEEMEEVISEAKEFLKITRGLIAKFKGLA
jgi:uncharacterized protein (UPF0332 family)